jgi:starvation-inducible outer membrane lipoprotein
MTLRITLPAAALVLTLAACAQKPENIQAAYISPNTYANLNCQQLQQEAARVDNAYARAADAQNQARSSDTMGVILIGLPVSSLSGANVAAQIADLKGRQEVLEQTMIARNCRR